MNLLKKIPIIIIIVLPFILFFKFDTLENFICYFGKNLKEIIPNLITVSSIFIGFLMTLLTIIGTGNNVALVAISKNKQAGVIIFYNVACIVFFVLLLFFSIFYFIVDYRIILYFLITSIICALWYIYLCCKIFYNNLAELYNAEKELGEKSKRDKEEIFDKFREIMDIVNRNILSIKNEKNN